MTSVFWKVLKEGRISLTLAAIVEVFAGTLLESHVEGLIALPILLTLIPPLNDMAGDLGTIIVARLNTSFYLGTVEPRILRNKGMRLNYTALIVVSLIACMYIGMVVSSIHATLSPDLSIILTVLKITLIAGAIATSITLLLGMLLSVLSFRMGHDPNIMVMPMITVIGDFLSIASVIFVCKILGLI